jgi:hypothetical protein
MQSFGKDILGTRKQRRLVLWIGLGCLACAEFILCLNAETRISDKCSLTILGTPTVGTNYTEFTCVFTNEMGYALECEFVIRDTSNPTNWFPTRTFASTVVKSYSSVTNLCQVNASWPIWRAEVFCIHKRSLLRNLFDFYSRRTRTFECVLSPEFKAPESVSTLAVPPHAI